MKTTDAKKNLKTGLTTEKTGLPPSAYQPLEEGQVYRPYVPAADSPVELSIKSILVGIFAGILFGAANAYLGLRAGLTISTSIPVAVISVAVFRILGKMGKDSSVLEANLSQTVGSASSSVASGVIFTLPALFLWGASPGVVQMTLLALSGGLLGVLFMVPLRRFLIVREHGHLPYPEGTACAQVLVAADIGGARARNVFYGLGIGALFKFFTGWSRLVVDELHVRVPFLRKGEVGTEVSAALFGVGYILGPRIALVMVGGGLLSSLVLIPGIAYWGDSLTAPLYPETQNLISDMAPGQIWTRYVRYIGAGAVATGGLITLIRSIPTMIESFRIGAQQIRERLAGDDDGAEKRTESELSLKVVGLGVSAVVVALALLPQGFAAFSTLSPGAALAHRAVAAVLVAIFAFFFVTVSSRIVGLVGVTSNPTSGMTIATLLATSSLFLLLGWTDLSGKMAALTVGCVVAIAASIAGDTSQDLKTGYLIGATPRFQQGGEVVGVITSAAFVCLTVIALANTYGFGTEELPAPQATLMQLVIDGVLDQNLPWAFVGIGVGIALLAEAFRIPSLPFAVGVYLPLSTMAAVFLGGSLRWLMEKTAADKEQAENRREQGVLFGSGLVGGEGLLGVAVAFAAGWASSQGRTPWQLSTDWAGSAAPLVGLAFFAAFIALFAFLSRTGEKQAK